MDIKHKLVNVFLIQLFMLISCVEEQYYKIFQVIAFNKQEREILCKLDEEEPCVNFLNGITNEAFITMEVAVLDECISNFRMNLINSDIEFKEVSELIIDFSTGKEQLNIKNSTIVFTHEYSIKKASQLLLAKKIKKDSPSIDKIVIGQSSEGKELIVYKLSTDGQNKYGVFLLGGEEGRDWATPVILMKVLTSMTNKETSLSAMLRNYNFYFMPLLNPDGHHYSINNNRFWARNRNKKDPGYCFGIEENEIGVNIDRNWHFVSLDDLHISQCNKENMGLKPFSEPETMALSAFLNAISPETMVFINLKGFGKMITIPYGYPFDESNNFPVLYEIIIAAQNEIQVKYNTTYDIGLTAKMLYKFAGGSADWVKETLDIPIVFTMFTKAYDYSSPVTSPRFNTDEISDQLTILLEQTLYYSRAIYGPIYDNDNCMTPNLTLINIILVLIVIQI